MEGFHKIPTEGKKSYKRTSDIKINVGTMDIFRYGNVKNIKNQE